MIARGPRRAIALAIALCLGLAGCEDEPPKTDRDYIRIATELRDQGDLRGSVNELKEALTANPANTEARWMLGQNYLTLGEGAGAEKELRRAADLGVDWNDLVAGVSTAQLLEGNAGGALETLELVQRPIPAVVARVAAARGEALVAQHKFADAAEAFERGLAIVPTPVEVLLGDARLSFLRADPQRLHARLEAAAAIDADAPELRCLQGRVALFDHEFDAAREHLRKVLERAPKFAWVRRCAWRDQALLGLATGDTEAMQAALTSLRKEFSVAELGDFLNARVALRRGRLEEAQGGFESVLRRDSADFAAHYFLALTHARRGSWQQAADNLYPLLTSRPGDVLVQRLMAIVDEAEGRRDAARRRLLERLWGAPDDHVTLAVLALLATRDPRVELRRDVGLDGVLSALEEGFPLALAPLPFADPINERDGFWAAMTATPELPGDELAAIRSAWRAGDLARAEAGLRGLRDRFADTADVGARLDLLFARLKLTQEDSLAAMEAVARARSTLPDDPWAGYLQAAVKHQIDPEHGGGRAEIAALLAAHPDFGPAQVLVAASGLDRGEFDLATTALDAVIATSGNATLIDMQVRMAIRQGHVDQALAALKAQLAAHPDSVRARIALATVLADDAQWSAVLDTLQPLPGPVVAQTRVRRLIAVAAAESGDLDRAAREYEALLVAEPDQAGWIAALARLRLRQGNYAEAMRHARALQALDLNASLGYRLEGDIARAAGNPRGAAFAYQSALSVDADPALMNALHAALVAADQLDEALQVLRDWLIGHPDDADAQRAYSEDLWRAGRIADALVVDARLWHEDSHDLAALRRLVGGYLRRNAWSQADEIIAEAASQAIAPLLRRQADAARAISEGRIDEGRQAWVDLVASPDADWSWQRLAIESLVAAGELATARELLDRLLAADVGFPGREDAAALRAELGEAAPAAAAQAPETQAPETPSLENRAPENHVGGAPADVPVDATAGSPDAASVVAPVDVPAELPAADAAGG